MRIKTLIKKLEQIKEAYGNVEVLNGHYETPTLTYLKSGAMYDLKGLKDEDERRMAKPIRIVI